MHKVRELLDKGADPTIHNRKGLNVIHFAMKSGDFSILSFLLEGATRMEDWLDPKYDKPFGSLTSEWVFEVIQLLDDITDNQWNILHYTLYFL